MTYKEKRELRRAAMRPQMADIIEGFIVGASYIFVSVYCIGGLPVRYG